MKERTIKKYASPSSSPRSPSLDSNWHEAIIHGIGNNCYFFQAVGIFNPLPATISFDLQSSKIFSKKVITFPIQLFDTFMGKLLALSIKFTHDFERIFQRLNSVKMYPIYFLIFMTWFWKGDKINTPHYRGLLS